MNPRAQAVIDEIEQHRERFERWCRSLSEEELNRPVPESTWQVKDFISHLATIDSTVGEWFKSIAAGGTLGDQPQGEAAPETGGEQPQRRNFNIDTWNDAQVAKRRDWTLDQIFDEARRTRQNVIDAIAQLDDAQLDNPIAFGGDSKRGPSTIKLGDYLTGWAKHDPIHVNDMIRALPEHRQDPDVTHWLDDAVVGTIARGYAKQMGYEEPA